MKYSIKEKGKLSARTDLIYENNLELCCLYPPLKYKRVYLLDNVLSD